MTMDGTKLPQVMPSENPAQDVNIKQELTLLEEPQYHGVDVKTETITSESNLDVTDTKTDVKNISYNSFDVTLDTMDTTTNLNVTDSSLDFTESIIGSPYSIQIKQELTVSIENEDSQSSNEINHIKQEETETILPINSEEVKDEVEETAEDEGVVSYDYPSFDDSMDSNDAAALSHVEACLSDDLNVKPEIDIHYQDDSKDEKYSDIIKQESELTVTETHLISNKLINTTSTVTSTSEGIIESQTTKTLVMEILPMTSSTFKLGNPEEILPTTENASYNMECDEPFQLNSITGNILTLEQEAYGLLKAKKKVNLESKTYCCPKCSKTFLRKGSLIPHLKVHESIERRALGVIKGLKTRIDNLNKKVKAEEEEVLKQNVVAEEEKSGYKCTCGKVFQRRSRMETCLRSHTDYTDSDSYSCPTCHKNFKSKELLTYHRNRQHRKKYPCKFCPTDYHTQKELFKHLQAHQKVQLMEYKVISEVAKGNQDLQCLLCSKTSAKLSDLKIHVMEDHKEPYNCPNCEQNFTRIVDFANHIKKNHPDVGGQSVLDVLEAFSKLVKAWKCEECGKQFHKADKLALHHVEEHTPEMKSEQHFQCEDCQRVFVSNQGLNSHRRVHHRTESTEEPAPAEIGVLCLECRKVCQDMTALTSHMRLHSLDRKYPCKYCDFRFATPQKRKAHAEIHTGDMKYVCFICEYQCTSENRLKHHKMSIKHLNMKEYLLTGKPLIEEESTSKQEDNKDSKKNEEGRGRIKKKKRRDKDPTEIACEICGEKFNNESDMQEHKQSHPFIEFPNDDKPSRIFFK